MKVERQKMGTVEVQKPIGTMTEDEAAQFFTELRERLSSPNPRVVIAMSEVPYLDSFAIEGFLDAADELADRASRLKLASVTSTCREIFELTGVASRFKFFNDVQDAVRSFL
jgi:anti-anti-sigma factor